MNNAPHESQPLRHVGTVRSDGLLRGGNVSSEEGFDALGLGEQIRRMYELRCLDGDHPGEVKDILVAEKVKPSRLSAELLVEKRIVIWFPGDLEDIKVAGNTEIPTEAAQLFPFHRLTLDAGTNLAEGVRKLASLMLAPVGCFNLLGDVGGNLHVDAARQCGLPLD